MQTIATVENKKWLCNRIFHSGSGSERKTQSPAGVASAVRIRAHLCRKLSPARHERSHIFQTLPPLVIRLKHSCYNSEKF